MEAFYVDKLMSVCNKFLYPGKEFFCDSTYFKLLKEYFMVHLVKSFCEIQVYDIMLISIKDTLDKCTKTANKICDYGSWDTKTANKIIVFFYLRLW